ncbi:MAG: hypothetical protein EPO39_04860 [Candidatus Manganitrophaceae bacterium]|nr:MAG: hypothetical protein EPO39_04860 [Candidatus Manganitrophaceae bacterium]
MILVDFLVALVTGLILTVIFWPRLRKSGLWANGAGWAEFLWFFLVVFLASWLGGIWAAPAGPPLWGIYWVPFLMAGFLFALLLAATAPMRLPHVRRETPAEAREEPTLDERTFIVLNLFYWLLLLALLASILAHYRR